MARVLPPLENRVKVLVSGTHVTGATTINLNAGQGALLPDPATEGEYNLVFFDNSTYSDPSDDPNCEDVHVTGLVGDVITCDPIANDHDTIGVQYILFLAWDKDAVDTVDDLLQDMIRSASSITYNSDDQPTSIVTPTRTWTLAYDEFGDLSTITTNDAVPKVYTITRNTEGLATSITFA